MTQQPHDSDPLLTVTDISRELGLRSSAAVSNWRKRYPTFPAAADRSDAGAELFRLSDVNTWLRSTHRDEIHLDPAASLWQQVRLGALGRRPEESVLEGAIAALTVHHLAGRSDARPRTNLRDLLGDTTNALGRLHALLRSLGVDEPYLPAFDVVAPTAEHMPELLDAIETTDPNLACVVIDALLARWTIASGNRGLATTSSSLARLAARLAPRARCVYDPACGPGNFFTAVLDGVSPSDTEPPILTGQEINSSAWSIAVLRLLARDVANFDVRLGDTLLEDALPSLRADVVLADPPYNQRGWGAERLLADVRWRHGAPADRDANTAWLQHALHHLSDDGRAIVVLPLGSLHASGRVGDIRRSMIAAGNVEAVITLPAGLASFTGIPLAIWILRNSPSSAGESVLLVDATKEPYVAAEGAERALTPGAIDHIASVVRDFREDLESFETEPGFAAIATTHSLLADPGVVLTPQQWVAVRAADASLLVDQFDDIVDLAARSVHDLCHAEPLRHLVFAEPARPAPPLALRDLEAADVITILRPGRLDKSDYKTAGTPVLTQTALQRDGSPPRFERYVDLEAVGHQVLTQAGDVILATIGDRPYAVVDPEGGAVLGNNLELLRIQSEWLDPELVAACLSSSNTARAASGSAVKRVRLRDLTIPALSAETAEALRLNLRRATDLERAARDMLRATCAARDVLIEAAAAGISIAESVADPSRAVGQTLPTPTSDED